MRLPTALLLVCLALVLGACGTLRTTYDYDPGYGFPEAGTWGFMPEPESGDRMSESELAHRRIRTAIEIVMDAKGFREVDENPDIRIGYHTATQEEVTHEVVNSYYDGWGYGYYRRPYYYGGMMVEHTTVRDRRWEVGTLVVDVYDVASRELVWRGSGEETVHHARDPQKEQAHITEAVTKIMEPFPPGN
jgi:hypothetical protein